VGNVLLKVLEKPFFFPSKMIKIASDNILKTIFLTLKNVPLYKKREEHF